MCIFCEIAKGNINSYKIYEDELFVAILDLSQATKGHTLIIPKNHYTDLFELGEEETVQLGKVIKKVAKTLKNKLNCDGINVLNNNGEAAGQTVMHFHVHLIPQYKGKAVKIEPVGASCEANIQQTYEILK